MTAAFYLARAGAALGSGYASSTARRAGALAASSFAGHIVLVAYLASQPGYAGLLLIRGGQGVLNGLAWTAAQVMLASSTPTSWRGRAFALYGIAGSAGALLGDLLYASMGPRCLGVSAAAFAAASLIALLASRRISPTPGSRHPDPRGRMERPGSGGHTPGALTPLTLLALVAGVSYVSVMGVGDIAYIYYKEVLHISASETSALRGVAGFLGTLAGFGLGWLADIGGAYSSLVASYAAVAAGALLVPVPHIYVAGLGIALITAAGRAMLPTARKVASEYPRGNVYLGYLGAASNVASAAGGLAYGYAYTALGLRGLCIAGHCVVAAPLLASAWALLLPPLLLGVDRLVREKRGCPGGRAG